MPFAGFEDMEECMDEHSDKDDPGAYCARVHYEATGSWPGEKTADGDPQELNSDLDMVKLSKSEDDKRRALEKADSVQKFEFDAEVDRSVQMVYKLDDEFFIWGPASVEIVDKEDDRIRVDALEKALPQLLKRARLSYAHTDQIVGRILERFETKEPVEVVIDGETYKRDSFPTAVLDLDDGEPPAMYVAGEVYDDTEQAQSVREKIQEGVIDSYSISGEALVTQKKVGDGKVYNDILEIDLSAVTLCEEGMNQGAKFARVQGDVDDVEFAEVEAKSLQVQDGPVTDPESIQQVAKSDTMSEEETEKEDNESEAEPEFVKQDELPDSVASEQFVTEKIDGLVDTTVDKIADELDKKLPDGDLATVEYIDKAVEEQTEEQTETLKSELEEYVDEKMEDVEEKLDDLEETEEKEGERPPEPPEEEEEEEMEEEKGEEDVEVNVEEDEEEAPEPPEEDDERPEPPAAEEDKGYTPDELKEALPEDVYNVVSEYIGDNKQEKTEEVEKDEESEDNELEKQVRSILEGDGASSPAIPTGERDQEMEKTYEEDEDADADESPALSNFY